eukprot:2900306-Amphidinium_carterae.1
MVSGCSEIEHRETKETKSLMANRCRGSDQSVVSGGDEELSTRSLYSDMGVKMQNASDTPTILMERLQQN